MEASGTFSEIVAQPSEVQVDCGNCGARLILERGLMTADCPYCASPSVVECAPEPDRPRPRFALGFALDREQASAIAKRWLQSRGPFAHGGLKSAVVERARGIYLPAYLYSAIGTAQYSADIGEEYTEVQTYTTTDSEGNTVTHTTTETRTEWRKLEGEWNGYVADVVVTASRGLGNEELESIEPFDLRVLRRFGVDLVSGWIAEQPSLSREDSLRHAHAETVEHVGRELQAFMPGDSHSQLRYEVDVHDESAELTLLPVWVFALHYAEGKAPVRLLVNGQTGQAAGRVPLSAARIAAAVLLGLTVIAGAVLLIAGMNGR